MGVVTDWIWTFEACRSERFALIYLPNVPGKLTVDGVVDICYSFLIERDSMVQSIIKYAITSLLL